MKALILSVTLALGILGGAGVAAAEDVTVVYHVREANCPAIDNEFVTQFFTAPDTCTRVIHR